MSTPNPSDTVTQLVEAINRGNLEVAISLYEPEAVMVSEPGKVTTGKTALQDALSGFIALRPVLTIEAHQLIQAGQIALSCSHWNLIGKDPKGNEVRMSGRSSDILRQQSDGNWLIALDNPWGTDLLG